MPEKINMFFFNLSKKKGTISIPTLEGDMFEGYKDYLDKLTPDQFNFLVGRPVLNETTRHGKRGKPS